MDEDIVEQRRHFGKVLRDLREEADLSQQQAAKASGLSRQQWNRLECGETGTKVDTIIRLATGLGLAPGSEGRDRLFRASPYLDPAAGRIIITNLKGARFVEPEPDPPPALTLSIDPVTQALLSSIHTPDGWRRAQESLAEIVTDEQKTLRAQAAYSGDTELPEGVGEQAREAAEQMKRLRD
jgi:transcriptional regulator with XRE-family HTH domain